MDESSTEDLARRARPFVIGAAAILLLALAAAAALLPLAPDRASGTIAGGVLLLAGLAELAAGMAPGRPEQRRAEIMAGIATSVAGLLFLAEPLVGLFSASYVVIGWLFLRSGILITASLRTKTPWRCWTTYAGAADLILGILLILGLQLAALVVAWFGPTQEVVSHFSLIFAASFLVTGVSLLAMAGDEREALSEAPR